MIIFMVITVGYTNFMSTTVTRGLGSTGGTGHSQDRTHSCRKCMMISIAMNRVHSKFTSTAVTEEKANGKRRHRIYVLKTQWETL